MRFNRKYLERNGVDFSVKERMITARRGETYDMGELKVQALGSNDAGVSFLVHYGGKTIFHAGDLNDWSWYVRKGETHDEAYLPENERRIPKGVRTAFRSPYGCCICSDGYAARERYKNGIDYFLHTMDADAVFPMHLWGRYDLIPQYKKELILAGEPELAKKVMDIREENQIFEL